MANKWCIVVFLLAVASVLPGQQAKFDGESLANPLSPPIIVFVENTNYYPGESVALRALPLQAGLPAIIHYTLYVEKRRPAELSSVATPELIPYPSFGRGSETWVLIQVHSAPYYPYYGETEPFIRIPIVKSDRAWSDAGLVRIRVHPNFGAIAPQIVYFRLDSEESLPVSSARIVRREDGSLQVCGAPQGAHVLVFNAWIVQAVQQAVGPCTAFYGLVGPVRVAVYDPSPANLGVGQATVVTFTTSPR